MLNYKDYEEKIYNWLLAKHHKDNSFTFSLRQKASKGSETDIFIGTEKSNYFGTTFWTLPVYYPGSSSDSINLIFGYKGDYYGYKFEFSQTNDPKDAQNESILNVIKAIQEPLKAQLKLQREGSPDKKMFAIVSKHRAENYTDLNTMLLDIDKDLEVILPIVNKAIAAEKAASPNFTAHHITLDEFTTMQQKYEERKTKYANTSTPLKNTKHKKYWLYAPGRNAMYWERFYTDKIIGLGWDKLGDLSKYANKEAIKSSLIKAYGGDGNKMNDVAANYEFANEINIGDVIIVKKGRSELLGYGEVTSDYYFDNTREDYKNCRNVQWIKKGTWAPHKSLVLKTLTNITKYKSDSEAYNTFFEQLLGIINGDVVKDVIDTAKAVAPLNQILYGPPGTGKTYHTINEAIKIINPEFDLTQDRPFIKAEYDRLVNEKQIVFTTFHQSLSYEDFVEGIKPKTEGNEVVYEIEDGIFKQLCNRASLKNNSNFQEAYENLITEFSKNDNELLVLETPKGKKFRVQLNSNNNLSLITTEKRNHQGTLTREKLERHFNFYDAFNGWEGYANGIISYLENRFNLNKKGFENKNYVLIIDEINRGNVSAIFGELITLLEDSKRKGNDEALTLTLPYSKLEFSIPNNLYIIGTMNTADRSVEALDTALRRRFDFKEMMPDYDVIEQEYINDLDTGLAEVLKTINQRIEILIDRDHSIGHSYFVGVDTPEKLANAFNNKIVPLLQEYFYGDYGKIGLVLGEGFVQIQKNDTITFAKFKYDNKNNFITSSFKLKKITAENIVAAINNLFNTENN